MKRRNGISIFFILGIATLVTIAVTRKDNPREPSRIITDTGSSFARYGETFEDQMAFKGPIEINNIPLTIVTAPPPIPKQAHITLGEQREQIRYQEQGGKAAIYQRDIFIDFETPMTLKGFEFRGLEPTIKSKKNGPDRDRADEMTRLGLMMEKFFIIEMDDEKLLPTINSVIIITEHPDTTEQFALRMLTHETLPQFVSKAKIKFTVKVYSLCNESMVKNKSIYKLALTNIVLSSQTGMEITPNHDLPVPYKNFFVINCGE